MAKVESYEIRNKDGKVIRVVNYYSIHEVRKLYNQYLQELEKQKQSHIHDSFKIEIQDVQGILFVKSELIIWDGTGAIRQISLSLPIKKEVEDSIEFAKLISRLEKKSKTIILALEDPDEVKGEIEDIEHIVEKEQEHPQEIREEKKEESITPAQLRLISNFVNSNAKLIQSLGEFMNKNFGKTNIKDLTKAEASKIISVWMNTVKQE